MKGEAIVPLEHAILMILYSDRQRAYTSSELASLFNHKSTETVERVLDTLTGRGAVLGRTVGNFHQAYYTVP